MMTRKLTTALVSAALVLGVTGTALANTVPGAVYSDSQAASKSKTPEKVTEQLKAAGIKDVAPDAYYAGAVTTLLESGLLTPDENGNVEPEAPLGASEGVAVFAKVLGIAAKTDTPAEALAKAQQAGIASADLTADTDLPRMEVARLLGKALGVQPAAINAPEDYPFADYQGLSQEDRGLLKALYDLGIFKGFEDKTFRPNSILTKAQIAILVDRILGARQ
ncbi:MAG TPA: S-layer homology domain-containing protein [Symbiobacteriaceae bacterium]|nr:S-layer homology domain-containing protein [Symbiobacteriaceae bacterium]